MDEVLARLAEILETRKAAPAEESYVASLYNQGMDAILKKVHEEAGELLMAAKNQEPAELVHETADLWFHTLILLNYSGIGPEAILEELQRRFGRSGLTEKAQRMG